MKTKSIPLALIGILPCALAAQTTIFTDTFENRTAGSQLHGSTSSDGNATWNVAISGERSNITVEDDSGNSFVQSTVSSGFTLTQFRDTSGNAFRESDFKLEFDYLYLQSFNDNLDFRLQYRLTDDFLDLDAGGTISGYRVRLKASNGTNPDSVDWFLETDPTPGGNSLASGTFDVPNLSVAGNLTPGAPLSVALDVVGDNHKLTLNGTTVANITDSQFGGSGEDAMNFKLIDSRNRGFDNVSLTIPELSAMPVIFGVAALGFVLTARRRR